jgi:hypothetical protein
MAMGTFTAPCDNGGKIPEDVLLCLFVVHLP